MSTRAVRIVDGDRSLLDTWGIDLNHERGARLLLAVVGVAPAAAGVVIVSLVTGGQALPWSLDLTVATVWAAIGTVGNDFAMQARRTPHGTRFPRRVLRLALTVVLVVGSGTVLVLLPWTIIEALRLPGLHRRAERARLRFETSTPDDHRT
ncbi:MAG: hypothetical protein K0V04_29730 [Deltaproteobacteria bacterium]|nr:hypothetical protein [Deltaproteobacteria bacterium]